MADDVVKTLGIFLLLGVSFILGWIACDYVRENEKSSINIQTPWFTLEED